MKLRQLGNTDMYVSPVAMGCWPIAGVTSVDVTEQNSLSTLQAAFDAGVNFFDTAYIYGYEGESERLIAAALGGHRDQIILATKCGLHWGPDRQQARDARPETIFRECDESLRRLRTDRIDLYYLHASDPMVPVADSAGALLELQQSGKIRAVGVSNFSSLVEYEIFHSVCPITAVQPPYNMLQREIEADLLPWCRMHGISAVVYWPLMKGFLAGKLQRSHVWDPRDGRQKYPVFVGEEWDKTHDFVDRIRVIANEAGLTVAQLVIAWTIRQAGITAALCGAKRPDQIRETAFAMNAYVTDDQFARCWEAIEQRGPVATRPAVMPMQGQNQGIGVRS
ncbi:aldo/keto reductase [Planctomicrobium piriforme]|uniref:Predicted oxidoreductase n=1 Tax=Planctomicrobium piriforme TaxID=1576369 RepID=A0A1I3C224_9PLAN|nr:aldo/keto reductase [Planctomicrobium piriforme]SFH68607.1 Predicted oxidoreductase [Planctomicrobium piriforme]